MSKLDWASLSEGFSEPIANIQGILADPPWNFIVDDGRNDGACRLTMTAFEEIMEKAMEMMPNGIVSIWTHKAILPEVVSIMHGLGTLSLYFIPALNTASKDHRLRMLTPAIHNPMS